MYRTFQNFTDIDRLFEFEHQWDAMAFEFSRVDFNTSRQDLAIEKPLYAVVDGTPGDDSFGSNESATNKPNYMTNIVIPGEINTRLLDGSDGFALYGELSSIANAGDINGDGYDDFLIGSSQEDTNGTSRTGATYLIFGSSAPFSSEIDLSSLDGSNGFVINGIDRSDRSGSSISSDDINGDGYSDIIIGAYAAGPDVTLPGDTYSSPSLAGETYVIFGRPSTYGASFDLSDLNGNNGFTISGNNPLNPASTYLDRSGIVVSGSGDINGDGYDDIIIGTALYEGATTANPGLQSYVVFGTGDGFASNLNLPDLDGNNGFMIRGASGVEGAHVVANAGDFNNDGFDDILISGPDNLIAGANNESYVIFGKATAFGAIIDLTDIDGTNGFIISFDNSLENFGFSVSTAGDFNGDGFDDILLGDADADEAHIIYGTNVSFGLNLNLDNLNGSNGFTISGSRVASSISNAGDVNGDGFDDILIGASIGTGSGGAYVIFGTRSLWPSNFEISNH